MLVSDTHAVISIHGLWMTGMEMALLRRRLKQRGFEPVQFSYPTVSEGLAENTRRLSAFISQLPCERVHLVAHSLGGVLALHTLRRYPIGKVDRVVCLGSPLTDSSAARNFGRWRIGRAMLGRTIREGVLETPLVASDLAHEVGVIGGTVGLGLGMFVGALQTPHDGMVTERETRLPGLTDHLMLPVNHFGLILSRHVAEQTAAFLADGRFSARG